MKKFIIVEQLQLFLCELSLGRLRYISVPESEVSAAALEGDDSLPEE